MYTIESNIPLVNPKRNGGRPTKYPFADMAIGQSFKVDVPEGGTAKKTAQAVANAAQTWVKRNDAKMSFSVRMIDAQTVRAWAVARRPAK